MWHYGLDQTATSTGLTRHSEALEFSKTNQDIFAGVSPGKIFFPLECFGMLIQIENSVKFSRVSLLNWPVKLIPIWGNGLLRFSTNVKTQLCSIHLLWTDGRPIGCKITARSTMSLVWTPLFSWAPPLSDQLFMSCCAAHRRPEMNWIEH